jgi:hypothetical protein
MNMTRVLSALSVAAVFACPVTASAQWASSPTIIIVNPSPGVGYGGWGPGVAPTAWGGGCGSGGGCGGGWNAGWGGGCGGGCGGGWGGGWGGPSNVGWNGWGWRCLRLDVVGLAVLTPIWPSERERPRPCDVRFTLKSGHSSARS